MNEEIDIIELLKRVKEGKAPKLIQIGTEIYHIKEENLDLRRIYETVDRNYYWDIADIYFDTKIKILDKPIIEELNYFVDNIDNIKNPTENEQWIINCIIENKLKINEIIRVINNKE